MTPEDTIGSTTRCAPRTSSSPRDPGLTRSASRTGQPSEGGRSVMLPEPLAALRSRTSVLRLALRVSPGSLGELDVRGAQRVLLPIVSSAGKPVDLELPPGVYPPKTAEITVAWGPAAPAT